MKQVLAIPLKPQQKEKEKEKKTGEGKYGQVGARTSPWSRVWRPAWSGVRKRRRDRGSEGENSHTNQGPPPLAFRWLLGERGKRNEVNNKPGHRGQGSPGVVGKGEVVHTILVIGAVWHFPASVLQIQVR